MMILTEGQRTHFRLRAGYLVSELQIKLGLKLTQEQLAGWLAGQLEEACGIGHSIAFDEVRSTPWEYHWCSLNVDTMNELSAAGWEFVGVIGSRMDAFLWRRRRAVREWEVKSEGER